MGLLLLILFRHGIYGAKASKDATKILATYVRHYLTKNLPHDQIVAILKDIIGYTHLDLIDMCKKSKLEYGTTGIVATFTNYNYEPKLVINLANNLF